MTLLPDGDARFGGVQMGASSSTGILWDRLSGLVDLPRPSADNPRPQRIHDPAVPGWSDIGWRQIIAENVQVMNDSALMSLRAAMADRLTLRAFTFHDSLLTDAEDLMVMVVADQMPFGRTAAEFVNRNYQPSIQWLAADPTIYSAVAGNQSFGGGGDPVTTVDLTVTNNGTMQSPSGRAWTLRITAHGTVTNPSIRRTGTGQVVTWAGLTMTSGQVLEVDENRCSWIGALGVDGYVTSGGSDFPNWPTLPPGESTIRIACASGALSGNFHPRSTW